MNPRIIFRLVVYFSTIMLLMAAIGWIAQTSWRRIDNLHAQITSKLWKSFQIADHLQQSVLELNNSMLRYAAYRNAQDWTNFTTNSVDFSHWLEQQERILAPTNALRALESIQLANEQKVLEQIQLAYENYQIAAINLFKSSRQGNQTVNRLVDFRDVEKESRHVLDLGLKLSETHQQSIDAIQKQNLKSLNILRIQLMGALVILLGVGIWLAIVVYREMIAPLKVQLIESQHLAERQEKLASLGMLAAGVAHEIRNPLTAIKAWLYLQQKHLKPGTPESEDAELIGSEINRLERIVKDFLQFARPSEPQFVEVPAGQPLQESLALMQPQLEKSGIKIIIQDIAPARIRIDPQQIKQVLINLIQNAAESIVQEGTISLCARRDERRINNHEMDVVILEVSDTGKGIPPEAEKRLFDPFFTTKETGTGLGLPIAARIVEKNGGALQYQTRLEHGTTFGIILPLQKS